MQSWEDEKKAELAEEFPGWDIWYVRNVVERSGVWCARPKGAPVAVFQASYSEALALKLRTAEAEAGKP